MLQFIFFMDWRINFLDVDTTDLHHKAKYNIKHI